MEPYPRQPPGYATAFELLAASIRTLAGMLWTLEGVKALEGPLLTTLVLVKHTYNISAYDYSTRAHLYVHNLHSNYKFITSVICNAVSFLPDLSAE